MVGKITKVAVMLLLSVTCAMADEFRVTAFSVGETSVSFSVAWPVSQTFPDGTIDVLYRKRLNFDSLDGGGVRRCVRRACVRRAIWPG